MLGTILIVIIVLLLLGALPTWPHSRQWGALPSGGQGLILLNPPRPDVLWPALTGRFSR